MPRRAGDKSELCAISERLPSSFGIISPWRLIIQRASPIGKVPKQAADCSFGQVAVVTMHSKAHREADSASQGHLSQIEWMHMRTACVAVKFCTSSWTRYP